MSKEVKKWNIKTRFQSSTKSYSTEIPAGYEKRSDYTTTVITGWNGDIAAEMEKYKAEVDWEKEEATWHELSFNTENPLNSLTIKSGTAYRPKEGDWREPIPPNYGFYLCGTVTNKDEDYIKIHDPWKLDTVNGANLFARCSWLTEWNFPMPMLETGTNMFSYTFMRKFRDPSVFGTSLSRLNTATNMFQGCSLDAESIRIISEQIKDWSDDTNSHPITLHIDTAYKDEVADYLNTITEKGWTVTTSYTNFYIA